MRVTDPTKTYRLADAFIAEPLVNHWSAWWLTIAPIPASLHFTHTQRPAMQAYLDAPALHEQLSKDPSLSGNACLGVAPAQAHEIAAQLRAGEGALQDWMAVAAAVEQLHAMLRQAGQGQSLVPLYPALPPVLRGLVELVYDYHNRPSFRLIEPLTYRSGLYKPQLQSLRLRNLRSDSDRPFLFTTPAVVQPGEQRWQLPFADPRLDALFRLDCVPQPLDKIRELWADIGAPQDLAAFLTDAPLPAREFDQATRVHYLGHAMMLIQSHGVSILIDPFVSASPLDGGADRPTFQALPSRIDYVLITHAHADHLSLETLLRLRHRIGCLVVPRSSGFLMGDVSLRLMMETLGFRNVLEIDTLQSIALPGGGEIIGMPFLGEHGDLAHAKNAYVIRADGLQMLFAADSACLDAVLYERVREAVGRIPVVFMNSETEGAPAAYTIEALFPQARDRGPERDRRCRGSTSAEAAKLLKAVGARRVYNYAMGLEPWFQHVLGPASAPGSPRMRDSDALLQAAIEAGLEHAQRLCGPQEIALPSMNTASKAANYELTI